MPLFIMIDFRFEYSCHWRPIFGFGIETYNCKIRFHANLIFFSVYLSFRLFVPETHLTFDIHHGSIWIRLFTPDTNWDSTRPWYQNVIVFHVMERIWGKVKYETKRGEPKDIVIPMPEGCYKAIATYEKSTWSWPRWPFSRSRESWDIDLPRGIPFCGKGENSWDCDDDALCGMSGGPTLEDAIGTVVTKALQYRNHYGSTTNKVIYAYESVSASSDS